MTQSVPVEEPQSRALTSNKDVEDAAIAFVIDHERHHGRTAYDTRHRGAPADVQSDDRLIEIKATGRSARGQDLWLEVRQVEEARVNPNFHVYVVDNVRQGNPDKFRLIDLHGEVLARLLERAKEQRYYSVPFPVAVYDELAGDAGSRRHRTDDDDPGQSGGHTPVPQNIVAMPRTRAVEWILRHHDGPMRPVEIWMELRRLGRDDPKEEISVTAHYLSKRGLARRAARGFYDAMRPE